VYCELTVYYGLALQVEHPRIAKLIDGRVLMGRDLGITTIQVHTGRQVKSLCPPLSSSLLRPGLAPAPPPRGL